MLIGTLQTDLFVSGVSFRGRSVPKDLDYSVTAAGTLSVYVPSCWNILQSSSHFRELGVDPFHTYTQSHSLLSLKRVQENRRSATSSARLEGSLQKNGVDVLVFDLGIDGMTPWNRWYDSFLFQR